MRLCDLELTIEGSWLEGPIDDVREELCKRNLALKPHFWLSEEWFCPQDSTGVALPFFLAHPRLMQLERRQMYEVEGSNYQHCLKLLRHEIGHAMQHGFRLQRRRKWQQHFGSSSQHYPDAYRPNPRSKRYVLHLALWYAQSHPDEDFAETFAVWFKPRSLWRKRYAGWPALSKLTYVDDLMAELAGKTPPVRSRERVDSLAKLKMTLRQYYQSKGKRFGDTRPDIYDRDLKRLFSDDPQHRHCERAGAFLRRNRTEIRRTVSRWTGEYQFTLDAVFEDMLGRCRELKLRAAGPERQLKLDFAILLTVRTMNYLYGRRRWHAL